MTHYEQLSILLAERSHVPFIGAEKGREVPDGIARFDSPHGSRRYVFFKRGTIIGAAQFVEVRRGVVQLAHVFVTPSARRSGIARQLIEAAEQDYRSVLPADEDARSEAGHALSLAVFKRNGFRPNLPAARVPALQSFPWLHGTTNVSAEHILKDGQLKPYRSIYTGALAPLPGRVYLASEFGTAINYAVTGLEEDRFATEGVVFTCELLPGMDVVLDEDLADPMGVVQYMEEKRPDLDWKAARNRGEEEKFAIEHMDDEDTQLFFDSIVPLRAVGRTALNVAVKGKVPVVAAYSWPRNVLLVKQKKRFVEARGMNPIVRSKFLYESLIPFATQIL